MLQKMFLIAAALLLLVLQNANATPPESDTIWTRTLGDICGSRFTLTGDSIIVITGQGGGDSLLILETATGKTLKSYKCKPWVYSFSGFVHFNTKSWVAISIEDYFGGMYIYDYLKDSIVNEKFGFLGKAIAITKDDKYIYVQNNSVGNKNISIYDVEKGEVVDSISSGYGTAHSLALSPDNKYLAIGTGELRTVNPYPNDPGFEEDRMFDKIEIIDLEKMEIIKEFDGPFGTEGEIREIKFSPDGKYLGVAKLDGTVRVYDMINLELYRSFSVYGYSDHAGPWVISFSNNSSLLYCGLFIWNNWKTEIFNIESNKLLKSLDIYSYSGLLVDKNDYLLMAHSSSITYFIPNWLTGIIDLNNINKDTNNISIYKSTNSIYKLSNIIEIKSLKFYDYSGEMLNTKNYINFDGNYLIINAENLTLGIYFLIINEDKLLKIFVTE